MDIEAISGAATVALASTIFFLLVAKSWAALNRSVGSTPSFAESIMHEAAQRFRDELERLSASQAIYLSGTLVFLVLFAAKKRASSFWHPWPMGSMSSLSLLKNHLHRLWAGLF